jgi:hypothetical protein
VGIGATGLIKSRCQHRPGSLNQPLKPSMQALQRLPLVMMLPLQSIPAEYQAAQVVHIESL